MELSTYLAHSLLIIFTVVPCRSTTSPSSILGTLLIPDGFKLGIATSAIQTEGAWNVSGKTESVWDVFSRKPGAIKDNSNANDACKSYKFWKRDIEMLKYLGVDVYRFSISWPRLLPLGHSNLVSSTALKYYNNIINALLEANIEPAVTIYHWDLPQSLQELGGWTNPLVVDWLEDFGRVLFENFGDRVKTWITINEPTMCGYYGYGMSVLAPGIDAHGFGEYITARNMLMAHARLYHLYDNIYRCTQQGMIGIVTVVTHDTPRANTKDDKLTASDRMDFDIGIYMDPIFSEEGGFPKRVIDLVAKKSAEQGYNTSRCPQFSDKEIAYIKGTSDFLGMNYYYATKNFTRNTYFPGMYPIPSLNDDVGADRGDIDFEFYGERMPLGIKEALLWLKERYNNPKILITENGLLSGANGLRDVNQLTYHKKYLYTILDTMYNEGVNVIGYIAWSLMDVFEWNSGYTASPLEYSPLPIPDGFKLGIATAAYQIEGAWNVSGKTESIWDVYTRKPGAIKDNSNGNDACKSYEFWERDIEMLKYLGVDVYRFSMSWTRLLPTGYSNNVSATALEYYNNIITALLQANIEPVVTVYHWDLPQNLQDLGGWANPLVADWLEDFGRVLFNNFGDRVKTWITINEPIMVGYHAYGMQQMAPGLDAHGFGEYITARNILMAHARLYHLYNNTYRPTQKGTIGIVELFEADSPKTAKRSDILAASDAMEFGVGIFLDPIFSNDGGFTIKVIELVANKSTLQGYRKTRFPQLPDEEISYIKGTSDFLGLNYYFANKNVTRDTYYPGMFPIPSFKDDLGAANADKDFEYQCDQIPYGIKYALLWATKRYNNPKIIITENGFLKGAKGLKDEDQLEYQKKHLYMILDTMYNEGVNVIGYIIWSLMDVFEWNSGYTIGLGMYQTDFSSANRTRTLRLAGAWYRDVIASRKVDLDYVPDLDNVSY